MAMVLEREILPIFEWLAINGPNFLGMVAALVAIGLFVGYLVAALRHGPGEGARRVARSLRSGLAELAAHSPRRVYAIARLAFQESIRRRVLVVFALFILLLSFAGWFLDRGAQEPARLYLSFVLTTTNYLVMLLAVFLAAFSLPNDIKNRTIYTVVTKPVRAWELIVGRMLGFAAIGTLLLVLMGLCSYIFVMRGMAHEHTVAVRDLVAGENPDSILEAARTGQSSRENNHRHEVALNRDGTVTVVPNRGHTHYVRDEQGEGEDRVFHLTGPEEMFEARIPVRGKLRFLDRGGNPAERGVNVGNEWSYRSFIEGGTLAAAIWTFDGISATNFPEGLPLEMTIRVFRTYKGIIDQGIAGKIELVSPNPNKPLRSAPIIFTAREFTADRHFIPRKIKARDDRDPNAEFVEVDVFNDLVYDGKIEVWIRCLERAQYYGVAQADVYLRAADGLFAWNFAKGYLSLWFQMVLITALGVMFSTFLSGPVSMLATIAAMVLGLFTRFILGVAIGTLQGDVAGAIEGGGPLESLYRLITQMNVTMPLENTLPMRTIQGIDVVIMTGMSALAHALPDFRSFSTSNFVAYGFDIPGNLVGQHALLVLAYLVGASTAAYFLFKGREIAA